jgi:hypothetical protein
MPLNQARLDGTVRECTDACFESVSSRFSLTLGEFIQNAHLKWRQLFRDYMLHCQYDPDNTWPQWAQNVSQQVFDALIDSP